MQEIVARTIIGGKNEGFALVSSQPFSFWGGLDPKTGKIINPRSDLYGETITGKVFIYPGGSGSSTTSAILLEAIRCKTAPRAIINIQVEPIIAIGILVAQQIYPGVILPTVAIPEQEFRLLKTGDFLRVDTSAARVYKMVSPAGQRT